MPSEGWWACLLKGSGLVVSLAFQLTHTTAKAYRNCHAWHVVIRSPITLPFRSLHHTSLTDMTRPMDATMCYSSGTPGLGRSLSMLSSRRPNTCLADNSLTVGVSVFYISRQSTQTRYQQSTQTRHRQSSACFSLSRQSQRTSQHNETVKSCLRCVLSRPLAHVVDQCHERVPCPPVTSDFLGGYMEP